MKLHKWLDSKNKDYKWFAQQLEVSHVAVWYWLKEERRPRKGMIDKISVLTKDAVKGRDFY